MDGRTHRRQDRGDLTAAGDDEQHDQEDSSDDPRDHDPRSPFQPLVHGRIVATGCRRRER
jgi:hypothetical protein